MSYLVQLYPAVLSAPPLNEPPRVAGKFLYRGTQKLWIRGTTYGTFRPGPEGSYPSRERVDRDFDQMAENGINAVRVYTVPPRWLLDSARARGLSVMVGLAWEQHVAFLNQAALTRSIERRVREGVQTCAGHPAVLCYAVGSEIPSFIVRWHGPRKIERFLDRLCSAVRAEAPGALVTYVNFPSTAYLDLPFIDLVCFNVFLESREPFQQYLPKLQNIADERPLILSEIGLDCLRNGEFAQAVSIDWQVRDAFAAGCAGTFVFSWTDEWHRGGFDVEEWSFGLTDRQRRPRRSLEAVREAFADSPFPPGEAWPRISVVVCAHNEERLIGDCLDGLLALEYPDFEVIVVDDGSRDRTAEIAAAYGFKVIRTPHGGLSRARNVGMDAAAGKIIAYLDADARPDPHWLHYLAATFAASTHAAVGGPNLAPRGDGLIADCVASSPGGPTHVLLSDTEAEHIPGCNLAVRRAALQAIGGFDPQFWIAGDDVDVCWRLQNQGWTLGYSPAAVVWHHRRNSLRAFWRQQVNYGRAEALLEGKWPEKYNEVGHLSWAGRVYGGVAARLLRGTGRIYQGIWGMAPFQSKDQEGTGLVRSLPLMPEWYLILITLAVLGGLGLFWSPLLSAVPLLVAGIAAPLVQAFRGAAAASHGRTARSRRERLAFRAITACLHLVQPIARLWGRTSNGLTPWRGRSTRFGAMWPTGVAIWCESWRAPEQRLGAVEEELTRNRTIVLRGGEYSRWDLEVRRGLFGGARTRMAVEEHGGGKQLVRFRVWPRVSSTGLVATLLFFALASTAALHEASAAAIALGVLGLAGALRLVLECSSAMAAIIEALKSEERAACDSPVAAPSSASALQSRAQGGGK